MNSIKLITFAGPLLFAAGLLAIAGCATNQPTLDTSADAELSFDGLTPVKDAEADRLWVRPDFDLTGYTKLLVQPADVHYRPTRQSSGTRSNASVFSMTDAQKDRLVKIVSEEFNKALSGLQRYEIVDESGPDVLLLRGGLVDVVSRVPPQRAGRTDFYLSSVGEATLVIEFADSQSGAVLIRVADRRAASRPGTSQKSNVVTNTSEVRSLASRWANLLAKRLEHVSDVYTLSDN